MNCPNCQKKLPEKYDAAYCPLCGKNLPPNPSEQARELPTVKFNRLLFFGALLIPPVLTLLSAALMRFVVLVSSTNEGVTPMVAIVGGCIGGAICGAHLGVKAGKNIPARIGFSIVFSAMMIPVCVTLCCVGCGIGGYQMRFG